MEPENDPLGKRYRAYRPRRISILAGFLFGLPLIAGSAAAIGAVWFVVWDAQFDLPVYTKYGWCWFAVAIPTVLGPIFAWIGWSFLASALAKRLYSVELRTEGFRVRSGGRSEDVLWSDVRRLRQRTHRGRHMSTAGYSETLITDYEALRRDGKTFLFDGSGIGDFDEFVKILREVAIWKSIPLEKTEKSLL